MVGHEDRRFDCRHEWHRHVAERDGTRRRIVRAVRGHSDWHRDRTVGREMHRRRRVNGRLVTPRDRRLLERHLGAPSCLVQRAECQLERRRRVPHVSARPGLHAGHRCGRRTHLPRQRHLGRPGLRRDGGSLRHAVTLHLHAHCGRRQSRGRPRERDRGLTGVEAQRSRGWDVRRESLTQLELRYGRAGVVVRERRSRWPGVDDRDAGRDANVVEDDVAGHHAANRARTFGDDDTSHVDRGRGERERVREGERGACWNLRRDRVGQLHHLHAHLLDRSAVRNTRVASDGHALLHGVP